ncbi:ABATE domain-containing protein [Streptomyces sp. V2I9]|uniref:CGNR zinc finger domain-containing protein n=1 Tax=Streptomyces sp. V2I9 TaxID=3042304 RepID=UPI0027810DF7|nr:ABATE domain-containing protein [Streptomyces sp. V2I9]MDQ0986234.1 putative RNA-binding Zn ribbon-like protein [Streptomyces sp. V2I9]
MAQRPVTALASTIRHGGDGGVLDELESVEATARWLRRQARGVGGIGELVVDEELREAVLLVRRAVRTLFARAVGPAPPSPVDAHRLMPADEALAALNAASARELVVPQLHWPAEGTPTATLASAEADPRVRLIALLARDAVDFLSGPQREHLRACHAPRCARYFIRSHGRQEWCTPACGNRARVARHYGRAREAAANTASRPYT